MLNKLLASSGSKNYDPITSIMNAGQTLAGSTTTGTTAENGTSRAELFDQDKLLALMAELTNQKDFFSPQAAQQDAQAAQASAMRDILQQAMPQIQGGISTSGMYDSTTSKLLQSDLASRAATELAGQQTQTNIAYGNMYKGLQEVLSGIAGMQTGTVNTTKNKVTNKKKGLVDQVFGGLF